MISTCPTTKRTVGLQIIHNGHAIELLYRVGGTELMQVWHVKPLFVAGIERDETIYASDRCSRLHTQNV